LMDVAGAIFQEGEKFNSPVRSKCSLILAGEVCSSNLPHI